MTLNDPDDIRCQHCDGRHASDSCPDVPRRKDAYEIAPTQPRTQPAMITISKRTLTQMLHRYEGDHIRKGEKVASVGNCGGRICIFLEEAKT